MNLILLGAPGAGKGTVATQMIKALSVPQVSTGDMLREARRAGTELGKQAASFMDRGALVPDEVVIGIVDERLAQADCAGGFILDGFPRTIPQAEALLAALARRGKALDHVICLEVGEELLVQRLAGRRSCAKCGRPYHVTFTPPKVEGRCDTCDEPLVHRVDDREESVRNRLKVYADQTSPLVSFFQGKGLLRPVDGTGSPGSVFERVMIALGKPGK